MAVLTLWSLILTAALSFIITYTLLQRPFAPPDWTGGITVVVKSITDAPPYPRRNPTR